MFDTEDRKELKGLQPARRWAEYARPNALEAFAQ